MKNYLLLFALVWACQSGFAQGKGKISGVIKDSTNNQVVQFATISVIDANKKPVSGDMSDDQGKFTISKLPVGTYNVVISFLGYNDKKINGLKISDSKSDYDLGAIKLSTSVQVLQEVVIQGQKPLVEEKVDRTIYNAESDQTAKGGDATDVLKRVPMLSVDMDGNVSLRGSQNIKVLINNKPSTITASSVADALKQIPADQIKTVEVITSPSAKYDAEGSAGIINIITKKNTLEGATLNVDGSAGYRGTNLGLNGGYRKGKMGFSLGGFGRANYNTPGAFYNKQVTSVTNIQNAQTRNNGLFGNYTLGWDYDIDKNNSLTASVKYGVRNQHNYQDNLTTETYDANDNLTASSLKNVNTINKSGNIDASLNYSHLFSKPNREFNLLTLYSRSNGTNDFTNAILDESTLVPNQFTKNNNKSTNQESTIQADYQTPIGETQMLEFGGKEIMRKVNSDYTYYFAGADGIFVPSTNSSLNNALNYNQNITAGYLSYTASIAKTISVKAGTRYEYTTINAHLLDEKKIEIPSYGVVVPSVNISKRLENGNLLKLAYNRRIQRPSMQFLNPNIQSSNSLSITQGNPNLGPEYTNNYELSYNTNIQNTSLNFSSFMRTTNNAIQAVRDIVNSSDTIRTSYQNIGKQNAYGFSIFANVALSNKFSLNGGTDMYYAVLKNSNPTLPIYAASNQGWVTNFRMFGNYNFDKGWGLQFFGFYRGRQVQLQGFQGAFRVYSLSLKKDLPNKKGSIGVGAENFLTPVIRINNSTESPILSQSGYNTLHYFNAKITFSYRIGKMGVSANQPRKRSKKSINNDDLKEGEGGGDNNGGGGMQGGGGAGGGQRAGGGAPAAPSVANTKMAATDPTKVVNAEGKWTYTVESPQGGKGNLVLKKEGDKYTGTITNNRNNKETPLSSVTLKGNEITIVYEVSFGGNTMTITIVGTIKEDDLNGNMSVGQFGTFPVNAKREK